MHWISISLILLAVSFARGDPLTREENAIRLATCGKKMRSKVYKGEEVKNSVAPWSVFINTVTSRTENGGMAMKICTGTIISPRHILTATHCFATLDGAKGPDNKGWHQLVKGAKDPKNCDADKNYVITDKELLDEIFISLGDPKPGEKETRISEIPEKITLLKGCATYNISDNDHASNKYEDVAIIDLYEDLDLTKLQQACTATSLHDNRPGVELHYYGYGNNYPTADVSSDPNPPPKTTGVLRHQKIMTRSREYLPEHFFKAGDENHATIACEGDSGGGSIGQINGRNTIIGVLSQTSCSQPGLRVSPDSSEMHESVGFFSVEICKLTGVCDTATRYQAYFEGYDRTSKEPRSTTPSVLSARDLERNMENQRDDEPDAATDKLSAALFALLGISALWVV